MRDASSACGGSAIPPMSRRRIMFTLGPLSAFGPLSMDLYMPALPQLGGDLEVTDSVVLLTMSASALGLATGGFVFGPASDRFGRKPMLITGAVMFVLMSFACALAPGIAWLIAFRFVQGLGGASGMVVSRAVARDQFSGRELVRIFSLLALVSGLAPVLAPLAGGWLFLFLDWRGLFIALGIIGAVLVAVSIFGVRETLSPSRRRGPGLRNLGRSAFSVFNDRLFVSMVLLSACTGAAFHAYISMSSLVFQNEYSLSPQTFTLIFAINAAALAGGAQCNALLARRAGPARLLLISVVGALTSVSAVLALSGTSAAVWLISPLLALSMFFQGWIQPNTQAVGLERHAEQAGTAAALLGSARFFITPAVGPIAAAGGASMTALSVAMTASLALALALILSLVLPEMRRRHEY